MVQIWPRVGDHIRVDSFDQSWTYRVEAVHHNPPNRADCPDVWAIPLGEEGPSFAACEFVRWPPNDNPMPSCKDIVTRDGEKYEVATAFYYAQPVSNDYDHLPVDLVLRPLPTVRDHPGVNRVMEAAEPHAQHLVAAHGQSNTTPM